MGAISAVLLAPAQGNPRQQPLTLTAIKAMMGHSEPAAGKLAWSLVDIVLLYVS